MLLVQWRTVSPSHASDRRPIPGFTTSTRPIKLVSSPRHVGTHAYRVLLGPRPCSAPLLIYWSRNAVSNIRQPRSEFSVSTIKRRPVLLLHSSLFPARSLSCFPTSSPKAISVLWHPSSSSLRLSALPLTSHLRTRFHPRCLLKSKSGSLEHGTTSFATPASRFRSGLICTSGDAANSCGRKRPSYSRRTTSKLVLVLSTLLRRRSLSSPQKRRRSRLKMPLAMTRRTSP